MLALAAVVATIHVEGALDPARGRLSGHERIEVTNPTPDPLGEIYVWLYPNRLARPSPALDDVSFYWVYPLRFEPASMTVSVGRSVPHGAAGPGTLVAIALPQPIAPGATGSVEVDFATQIPERFGGFGCLDGRCTLLGGWAPMLAHLDEAGWDLDASPTPATWTGFLAMSGDAFAAARPAAGGVLRIDADAVPYVPIVTGTAYESDAPGVKFWSRHPAPPADDAAHVALPYTNEDYGRMVADTAASALDFLKEAGVPDADADSDDDLTILEAPLRLELALSEPGCVVVSDQLFRIFPTALFRRYHQRELVRAIFTARLAGRLGERDAEAAAGYLLDAFSARGLKTRNAKDVLSPLSFVPTVDELIYAPQVAFVDVYFGSIADTDRFRDDPRRFMTLLARGSVLYEKLKDLLPAEELTAAMRAVIVDGTPLRVAAEAASGRSLGDFFRTWEGPYPAVDYHLGARRVDRVEGGWKHTIEITRTSPPGVPLPIEPVDVRLDSGGHRFDLRWDGDGARGEVSAVTPSAGEGAVEIDPRARLVEASSDEDPRLDDRDPKRLKFLYNGFGALLNITGGALGLLADFSIERVHDTRNVLRLEAFSSASSTIGASVGYERHFGPLITPARRIAAAFGTLTVSRLTPSFGLGDRVSLSAGLASDDRLYAFDPQHASGISVQARASLIHFDSGGPLQENGALFLDATKIVTPAGGHTLVANVSAAIAFGDLDRRSELTAAGGPDELRGYLPTELFGRARVVGHLEWRGSIVHGLAWNLGHFTTVRGIQIAGFLDGGTVSSCDAYDLFGKDNLFADAGFGVRFTYDDLGVEPGMLGLDVAMPLVLHDRSCLGTTDLELDGRPPFMFYLTFLPPF